MRRASREARPAYWPQAARVGPAPALRLIAQSYPGARIIAVGWKAEKALAAVGLTPPAAVRHSANGWAAVFAQGPEAALA